jgi:hypothetical protein
MQHFPGMESMLHTLIMQIRELGLSVRLQVIYPQDVKTVLRTAFCIKRPFAVIKIS